MLLLILIYIVYFNILPIIFLNKNIKLSINNKYYSALNMVNHYVCHDFKIIWSSIHRLCDLMLCQVSFEELTLLYRLPQLMAFTPTPWGSRKRERKNIVSQTIKNYSVYRLNLLIPCFWWINNSFYCIGSSYEFYIVVCYYEILFC